MSLGKAVKGARKLVGMYDFIVVGAGSAGCAVAGKLAEDRNCRVLLVEAGLRPNSPWIRIPAGVARVVTSGKYTWDIMARRREGDNRAPLPMLVGKTLGGGSAVNGMMYMRSYPSAFDQWADFGVEGWGWDEVLDAYRRVEGHEDGESPMHGGSGPLSISRPRYYHRSSATFVAAGGELGARITSDLNDGESVDSIGHVQRNQRKGMRCSSYDAYVKPKLGWNNFDVVTEAHVRRIVLDNGRATGIEYDHACETRIALARREVILSAGAIFTPHLLQLSGIGPGAHLHRLGIDVAVDLPGVGANLQEHAGVDTKVKTVRRASMNRDLDGISVLMHGLRYLLTRRGPLTTGASQVAAMLRSMPDLPYPNLQMCFRPFTIFVGPDRTMRTGLDNSIEATCFLISPKSRGTVRLNSSDPHQRPVATYNLLSDAADEDALLYGVRWLQRCFKASPFAGQIIGDTEPPTTLTDEDIRALIQEKIALGNHSTSTCAMGKREIGSVVDSRLKVYGVEGLRIADASIMPLCPSGNTNAPCIMIGTRAADFIRAGD